MTCDMEHTLTDHGQAAGASSAAYSGHAHSDPISQPSQLSTLSRAPSNRRLEPLRTSALSHSAAQAASQASDAPWERAISPTPTSQQPEAQEEDEDNTPGAQPHDADASGTPLHVASRANATTMPSIQQRHSVTILEPPGAHDQGTAHVGFLPPSLPGSRPGSKPGSRKGSETGTVERVTGSEMWQRAQRKVTLLMSASSKFRTLRDMGDANFIPVTELQTMRVLGSGAFATVELALYTPGGKESNGTGTPRSMSRPVRVVAVKRLKPGVVGSQPEEVDAFLQEVQLARKLQHRNIVTYVGVGQDGKATGEGVFLVVEAMHGGTLKRRVQAQMQQGMHSVVYRFVDALRWCIDIAGGLGYLHSCQPRVIHRDLKLENILLSESASSVATAKLADFGLSALMRNKQLGDIARENKGNQNGTSQQASLTSRPATREQQGAWSRSIEEAEAMVLQRSSSIATKLSESFAGASNGASKAVSQTQDKQHTNGPHGWSLKRPANNKVAPAPQVEESMVQQPNPVSDTPRDVPGLGARNEDAADRSAGQGAESADACSLAPSAGPCTQPGRSGTAAATNDHSYVAPHGGLPPKVNGTAPTLPTGDTERGSDGDGGDAGISRASVRKLASPSTISKSVTLKVKEAQALMSMRTGTLMYMAPEVFTSGKYDEKADVFSFALIMYELFHKILTQYAATPRGTLEEVQAYAAGVAAGYRPPIARHIPASVSKVITACWAHDPTQRPPMMAVLDMLHQLQQGGVAESMDDKAAAGGGLCGCVVS